MPVLFDTHGRHPGQLVGRSPYMQPVHAEVPEEAVGTIRPVRIDAASANSLAGTLDERVVA
jgi:tRNA-2-methylthio-N6-dimethylallyladenosine synthase